MNNGLITGKLKTDKSRQQQKPKTMGKGSKGGGSKGPKSGATHQRGGWPAKSGGKSGSGRTTNPPAKGGKK